MQISRVTFVRSGSATHSMNSDQRFVDLSFTRLEDLPNAVNVVSPPDRNVAPPGYYMMFIFDRDGVPSTSKLIHLQD